MRVRSEGEGEGEGEDEGEVGSESEDEGGEQLVQSIMHMHMWCISHIHR